MLIEAVLLMTSLWSDFSGPLVAPPPPVPPRPRPVCGICEPPKKGKTGIEAGVVSNFPDHKLFNNNGLPLNRRIAPTRKKEGMQFSNWTDASFPQERMP